MIRNPTIRKLKDPMIEALFRRHGAIIPAEMQGKPPIGYIDLYEKWSAGKRINPANINDFLQHHSASFGITRSGKSNGTGKLCEQHILKGMRIIVVDYKGEFATLVKLKDAKVKVLPISGRNGKDDALEFIEGSDSFVLNLETITDTIYIPYLLSFFTELWELRRQEKLTADSESKMIVPTKIFVDEAQHYMPRQGAKAVGKELAVQIRNLKGIFRNIAQQGVGLGLPMHIITQRPTYIDPFIRNQCEVLLLYRQKWENDIEVYLDVIPANGGNKELRDSRKQSIVNLATGHAIYVQADGKTQEVIIKYKQTPDLSRTPGWAQQVEAMEAQRHGKDNVVGDASDAEEF